MNLVQSEKEKIAEQKRKAAEEAEKIKQSLSSLGKVPEVRSSAEASVSHNTDRNAELRASISKVSLRASKENPIPEEDERVEVSILEKARNTAEANPAEQVEEGEAEYYDEEEEYDEEYEEDFDKSKSSQNSKGLSDRSSARLKNKVGKVGGGVRPNAQQPGLR